MENSVSIMLKGMKFHVVSILALHFFLSGIQVVFHKASSITRSGYQPVQSEDSSLDGKIVCKKYWSWNMF